MEYKTNTRELFIFESKSLLGRVIFEGSPKLKKEKNYLNLGSGENILDGYVNADFFKYKFWDKTQKIEWYLDLRHPLKCEDNVFDGIYSEHTLEHLYPSQVSALLKELHRVLREGSILRITVPDLEKYVDFYNGEHDNIDIKEFNARYKTGCEALRNITQNYFHLSTWDFEELKLYLEEAGFKNVKKRSCNDSEEDMLKVDIEERSWETLYVEAVK